MPTFRIQGRPPDDWEMNGVRGWGLGSRVQFTKDGGLRSGIAAGALHWGEGEWEISVRMEDGTVEVVPRGLLTPKGT